MKDHDIKKDHFMPGHMVYADHYISRAPDRIYKKIASQINLTYSNEDVFLLTTPVVMQESSTKWSCTLLKLSSQN